MQRTITIQLDLNGADNGASDFEGRVQAAAHKALKGLCDAPLTTNAYSDILHDGISASANVRSVVADSGSSDA